MEADTRTSDSDVTSFRAETAWGTAVIVARDSVNAHDAMVVRMRPPIADRDDDPRVRALAAADDDDAPPAVRDLAASLAAYLDGEAVELAPRAHVERWLAAAGVDGFRRDLSMALYDVPRGVTLSYGELAALAGRPGAARAAGSTCARNPIPIVVPCHRVVHAGARRGDVGSYGAATGPAYKRRLLELEHAALVR